MAVSLILDPVSILLAALFIGMWVSLESRIRRLEGAINRENLRLSERP